MINGSAEPAPPSSNSHREEQIPKAGNDVTISMPTTIDDEHHTAQAKVTGALPVNTEARNQTATPVVRDDQPPEDDHQSMYKAATQGDWPVAETLLERDESLAWEEITEKGDRAIHLAILGKHTVFVRKVIEKVGWEFLEYYDGHGYTACCYAVMYGDLELVRILMTANPFIANAKNWFGKTPLVLAISYGNAEIVSHFLGITEIKDVVEEQLFDLLLVAIAGKMFDVALMLLEKKESLAVLQRKDKRTAFHVLAQMGISPGDVGNRQAGLLSEKLWQNIQKTGRKKVLELMENPPILHDAVKVGNLGLVKKITYDYPALLSHTDKDGNSIFHVIVRHRNKNMLELIKSARINVKNFETVTLDKDGNNLLHLAAKSQYPEGLESVADQDIEMRSAHEWFKAVEAVVPPIYGKMENSNREIPIALFWKEHKRVLPRLEAYVKKTAESSMLISTIVLTLVFAAAFAPPGGFDQITGIPILMNNIWFKIFIVFKFLALCSSTFSIIGFWSIISSKTGYYQFLVLPQDLRVSMCALLLSVLFVISAFLSAFFLVFVPERKMLAMFLILPLYTVFVVVIFYQILKVFRKTGRHNLIEPSSGKFSTLWRSVYYFGASIVLFFSSCFGNSKMCSNI